MHYQLLRWRSVLKFRCWLVAALMTLAVADALSEVLRVAVVLCMPCAELPHVPQAQMLYTLCP